jgi:hypothetical protein
MLVTLLQTHHSCQAVLKNGPIIDSEVLMAATKTAKSIIGPFSNVA